MFPRVLTFLCADFRFASSWFPVDSISKIGNVLAPREEEVEEGGASMDSRFTIRTVS